MLLVRGLPICLDQIYRDEEDMADDGSTGDLLTSLLNERAISVGA